jgi:hypothetical protein
LQVWSGVVYERTRLSGNFFRALSRQRNEAAAGVSGCAIQYIGRSGETTKARDQRTCDSSPETRHHGFEEDSRSESLLNRVEEA